ncbi:hypothetical protein FGW20_08515 [Methanoculleus sp. FWC-SCC3]|uniref:Uncharacterized protein n=1 Tax=Methanoculleus methanifontis TaxID=2584086 RepID=A0ABT8M3S4_9EURY|nr:hypothetical protein [Methanoculleus sp. FWC-SCC3]MDN7013082.1 hypothetical protein [Methanoculleus sp. FWC-SCC3]
MRKIVVMLALLVGFLLISGCTQSGDIVDTSATAQPTASHTTAAPQQSSSNASASSSTPKYQPGDIIDSDPTYSDPNWLVISYDPETDEYETAVIFKYEDGTWGYLLDEDTDQDARDFIEGFYPARIAHVELSDVKIEHPVESKSK